LSGRAARGWRCHRSLATNISADERGNFLEDEGLRDARLQVTIVQGVELFWRVSDLVRQEDTGFPHDASA